MTKPLVPHTPTIEIDYDKYGHCVSCHRYLKIERIVDGKVELLNHPDYDEEEFMLNDGSRMRVAICVKCHGSLINTDFKDIMKAVIKGWRIEIEYLKHWTDKQRVAHMKVYSKKKILFVSKDLPSDVTDKRFREYKEKK